MAKKRLFSTSTEKLQYLHEETDKYSTSTRQVPDKHYPNNPNVVSLVLVLEQKAMYQELNKTE